MNEARIEAALRAMGQMTPRAPEKTVEGMINKIRALDAKKQKLAARAEPELSRDQLKAPEVPKATKGGMKL